MVQIVAVVLTYVPAAHGCGCGGTGHAFRFGHGVQIEPTGQVVHVDVEAL